MEESIKIPVTIAFKPIPGTSKALALDCFGREFCYDLLSKQSSWEFDIDTKMALDLMLAGTESDDEEPVAASASDGSETQDELSVKAESLETEGDVTDASKDSADVPISSDTSDDDDSATESLDSVTADEFKSLLFEHGVSPAAEWETVNEMYGGDPRFQAVRKRLREGLFFDYCREAVGRLKEKVKNGDPSEDPVKKMLKLKIPDAKGVLRWPFSKFYSNFKKELGGVDWRSMEEAYKNHVQSLNPRSETRNQVQDSLFSLYRDTEGITASTKWTEALDVVDQTDERWSCTANKLFKQSVFWKYVKTLKEANLTEGQG